MTIVHYSIFCGLVTRADPKQQKLSVRGWIAGDKPIALFTKPSVFKKEFKAQRCTRKEIDDNKGNFVALRRYFYKWVHDDKQAADDDKHVIDDKQAADWLLAIVGERVVESGEYKIFTTKIASEYSMPLYHLPTSNLTDTDVYNVCIFFYGEDSLDLYNRMANDSRLLEISH